MKKTSKTEKCKNRKIKNKKNYIFGEKPYVKNVIFEKNHFRKTTYFNKKTIKLKILHEKNFKN